MAKTSKLCEPRYFIVNAAGEYLIRDDEFTADRSRAEQFTYMAAKLIQEDGECVEKVEWWWSR